jgi:protein tyrosine/serine phosphatase
MARLLKWDGCVNVRDLGGYPAGAGRRTRCGAVVRSDNPAYLSPAGWNDMRAYGVRTIVALRTVGAEDDEPDEDLVPAGITLVRVVVEDVTDREFVEHRVTNGLWGTPLYFTDALQRWPARAASAVKAVARAMTGGVVISCGRGCDRTGLLALLLLHLGGVDGDDIAADYAMSIEQMAARDPHYGAELNDRLGRHHTTVDEAIAAVVSGPIVETLRQGGLTDVDVDALRARFLEPC